MNLFASGAQMLGLLALALGGGALARKRVDLDGAAKRPSSRWPMLVTTGLLLTVSSSLLLYHLHVVDLDNRRLRANLVRSSTEAGAAVGDTSLKTLSFSGQQQHPRGVPTDRLAAWLAVGRPLNLIDVREPEEVEMGAIEGTWHRRYPDLQADPSGVVRAGHTTILLCESGNRSSELCDLFTQAGHDVHFLVGGYEKWVAEDRPMTGRRSAGSEIRATPDYPHKDVLIDTPAALSLYTSENAQFVDVRYPEDFAQGHLPGAVNIPLRKLREDEVAAALGSLPKDRPIVAACYDKRSSFYALLLGLRLHRLDLDYRGRYTVPHEFTLPGKEKDYVARWRTEREGQTLLAAPRRYLAQGVEWAADRVDLLAAILLLVVLLRTAMLPFSLAAERDQWQQRRMAGRLQTLREQWAHDPVVWRRESMRMLRQAGISPLRNLVGAVLQIVLFAFAFAAVDSAAAARPASHLLWFDLATPDATGVLPLLFGAIMFGFVRLQQSRKGRWVLATIFTVLMVAVVWQCRAAVQIYLASSIGLMAVQTLLQRRWLARRADMQSVERPAPRRMVPLAAAVAHPELGNKAVRLGAMIRAGLPVPPGFAVPWDVIGDGAALTRACRRAGIERAAVRSSAIGEDSAESSMAGMFLSELDVPCAGIPAAIAAVRASYGSRAGGVVVQAFRRAEYAGVMFTVDPVHAGRMLVEMVVGGGEALVSGRATPRSFRYGRRSGERLETAEPPIPLAELIELGRQVEALFGGPQDIEWVYVDGRFQLVQSRDITRLPCAGTGATATIERERARLLAAVAAEPADAVVFEQTEISELLPRPTTYSLSLFESLWSAGGSVDRACRAVGFPYEVSVDEPPMVVTAFGRTFVDRRARVRRSGRGVGAAASFRMATAAVALEESWRNAQPAALRRVARLNAMDPARLSDPELLELCDEVRRQFVEQTYARAETINLAAEFLVGAARRHAERAGLDPAALLRDDSGNVVSAAFALLAGPGDEQQRVDAFVAAFGHRAMHDFELAEARYQENPGYVAAMLPRSRPASGSDGLPRVGTRPEAVCASPASGRHGSPIEVGQLPSRVLREAVVRARRFQSLKEEAKHEAMRELAALRRLLVHVGARFGLGDGVFDLHPHEVRRLAEPAFRGEAIALANARAEARETLSTVSVPTALTPLSLERLGDRTVVLPGPGAGDLTGTCVAGSREVTATVRVIEDPAQLTQLQEGEILVTRCTDPCWLPAFAIAGGLVTEIGGWLSHAAIQAREYDLPTIVGAVDATQRLRTGDVVRLCRDGVLQVVRGAAPTTADDVEPCELAQAAGSEHRAAPRRGFTPQLVLPTAIRVRSHDSAGIPANGRPRS